MMTKERFQILIVEDEKNLSDILRLELEHEGYHCNCHANGKDALEAAIAHDYDIILLDLMLPGMNGMEVCRKLREVKDTPILMLTARDSVMDKVNGLQLGADDYLSKPFEVQELLARVTALLRRSKHERKRIQHRDITLDVETREVFLQDEKIILTTTEFELLAMFLKLKGMVVSRDEILNKVWGYEAESGTNIVDVYVKYLRDKIERDDQSYIHTVRGIGYKFE